MPCNSLTDLKVGHHGTAQRGAKAKEESYLVCNERLPVFLAAQSRHNLVAYVDSDQRCAGERKEESLTSTSHAVTFRVIMLTELWTHTRAFQSKTTDVSGKTVKPISQM